MDQEIWTNSSVVKHARIISDAYRHWTGKELFAEAKDDEELAKLMYLAPFVVISHGTESDPIFNYANKAAQLLWEMNWNVFTSTPSRASAEPVEEEVRRQHLEEGKKKGIVILPSATRITSSGKRFFIKNVYLFNLINENGYLGQCAIFSDWKFVT